MILDVGSGCDELDIARGDISIDLCKAPRNNPRNFICADAHHLPFREEVFDRVCMYEVIEHLENPLLCLREIYRILKQGGTIEVSTPNIFHWRILLRQMRGLSQILSDYGHIACWTKTEMQNILLRSGFSIIQFKYLTLPNVLTPHRILDHIARMILPSAIAERNLLTIARKIGGAKK
ncbi:class I SAM-dependent methyltransferase [Candidatus Methanodesulfokora washburnensis]|jgi:ubiquinone/menaquinone biosynthesis C-methylase UbiE|uniref:SAM-dependent methyltransferase n=1 Tax=Candidatus Methanodesulfokora washburnensis TaxID=2478471 RepID=A0A429GNY5_9CREN|nr:class I SAM-dependent methyltransferase [Candidatus Methanodesulfokores washburnensis]RSN75397.1 SAM-dependent methyltransferase [Candidatus Methanodesulfokores washburnensis]